MMLIAIQGVCTLVAGYCLSRLLSESVRLLRARAVSLRVVRETLTGWPQGFRQLAPLMALILPFAAGFVRPSARIANELRIAGYPPSFDDQQFGAYRIVMCFFTFVAAVFIAMLMLFLDQISLVAAIFWVVALSVMGYLLPLTRLRDRAQTCRRQVLRSFPAFLDVLALTLESGQHLASALQLAVGRLPESPGRPGLRDQIQGILIEIRSGQSRLAALQRFADRMAMPDVTQFVASVSTADRQGVSVTDLLRRQSHQMRLSRALAAERHAMKLPVKLLAPLAICIFPCTFLVISFPIVIRLSQSGLF
jgi:tight adherence protein C